MCYVGIDKVYKYVLNRYLKLPSLKSSLGLIGMVPLYCQLQYYSNIRVSFISLQMVLHKDLYTYMERYI